MGRMNKGNEGTGDGSNIIHKVTSVKRFDVLGIGQKQSGPWFCSGTCINIIPVKNT